MVDTVGPRDHLGLDDVAHTKPRSRAAMASKTAAPRTESLRSDGPQVRALHAAGRCARPRGPPTGPLVRGPVDGPPDPPVEPRRDGEGRWRIRFAYGRHDLGEQQVQRALVSGATGRPRWASGPYRANDTGRLCGRTRRG